LKNQSRADFLKADRLVWAYNLIWIFVLDGVRLITERFATYRTARWIKS
jgi:hypothetical protein